jgi:hypothetical protein
MSALVPGTLYFIALFGLGFVLGTIRVLFLQHSLGELRATLVEVPIMLFAAYFTCRWIIKRCKVAAALRTRILMGVCFLTLLLFAEFLLGTTLFGRTVVEQGKAITSSAGLVGLIAQFISALFPLIATRR